MHEIAKNQNIIIQWLCWQFFDVPRDILKTWRNFLLFNLNYFSILLLLKTLFSPWRKYRWEYPKGFDIGKYFEVFTSNLISRIMGTIMRVMLIFIGVLVEFFIILLGIIVFFSWLILPIFLILGFYHGFRILF